MKNYIKDGSRMPFTPSANVASGAVILVVDVLGVATGAILSGIEGELQMEGVVELTKDAPLVIAQGDKLYWVVADQEVSKTAGSNKIIGYAHKAAASADTTVWVKLHPDLA